MTQPCELVVAVDLGGTATKASLMDRDLAAAHTLHRPTDRVDGTASVDQLVDLVAELADHARSAGHPLRGVGVAVPGIVDAQRGVVRRAVNLGWRDLALRQRIADRVDVPVALGHDVRTGGLAEFAVGAGRGADNVVFMPIGTGFAAAIMVDGHVLSAEGYAGELGHIVVDPDGELCPCGSRGCLETVASAASIGRLAGLRLGRAITAHEVAELVAVGDPDARAVWDRAVESIADVLTASIALLAPQIVIVGGGLAQAGGTLFDPLRAAVAKRMTFHRRPEIVPAMLGDRAGCVGAAMLGWRVAEGGTDAHQDG